MEFSQNMERKPYDRESEQRHTERTVPSVIIGVEDYDWCWKKKPSRASCRTKHPVTCPRQPVR